MEQFLKKEDFIFKKFQNAECIGDLNDTITYIENWLQQNMDGKIIVGTDSQKYNRSLSYVTVISLFYPSINNINKDGIKSVSYCKGAHLIYFKQKIKMRKISLWERLWHEVELTRIISQEIFNKINKKIEVHLDLNPDAEYKSNQLYQSAVGYLLSFGFDVYAKPDGCVASYAADVLVKK